MYFAKVDENKKPIKETEQFIGCDTVLLSVGLIPENELTRKAEIEINSVTNGPKVNQYMQTSEQNIFACGNVVHVNDLVDNVSVESNRAGKFAAQYAKKTLPKGEKTVENIAGENVRYICPQLLRITEGNEKISLYFRVLHPDEQVTIRAKCGGKILASRKAARINPGEMEQIEFNTADICGDNVIVEVVREA